MKSIISNRKTCVVCGSSYNIHKHHIFFGTANRTKSEQYGCWCYLCMNHHTGSCGVHTGNAELDRLLKVTAQRKFQQEFPNKDFIEIFGKNYL